MAATMGKDVIKSCLKAVPLFADLSADELERLAAEARSLTVRKKARIFEEGSAADCCLVLTSGKAKVVLSGENGTEIMLGTVQATSLVGEVALLDRSTRSASLVAAESCHFIRIPANTFEQLRRNSRFEDKLMARVVSMLRDANDQVRGIATFPAVSRVAWCLGRVARQSGRLDGASVIIPKVAHQELAEMTGCSRETVTRALATLRRKKHVSWTDQEMRIDLSALHRLLGGQSGTAAYLAYRMGPIGMG